jgi:hypothetical protein
MAKVKVCNVPSNINDKLQSNGYADKSGVGVHYIDAYIKPMNQELEDGTKCIAKRRGLKVTVTVGDKSGSGLMRKFEVSADPVEMLQQAITEINKESGFTMTEENGAIYIDY